MERFCWSYQTLFYSHMFKTSTGERFSVSFASLYDWVYLSCCKCIPVWTKDNSPTSQSFKRERHIGCLQHEAVLLRGEERCRARRFGFGRKISSGILMGNTGLHVDFRCYLKVVQLHPMETHCGYKMLQKSLLFCQIQTGMFAGCIKSFSSSAACMDTWNTC